MDDGEKEYYMVCHKAFTQKMVQKYSNAFKDIGKLEGTVQINLWDGTTSYQADPWWVVYMLQKPLHDDHNRLIKNKIIAPLKADEKSE